MEDENEVIQAESPQGVDPQKELNDLFSSSGNILDSAAASKAYNLPGFGDSQYDKNIKIDAQLQLNELFNQSLEQNRAGQQPNIDKLGNAVGRLTNIIPEAIGGMAAVLDFEDYFNSNDEVGNWLTDLTNKWKESTNEALPIYRKNRGEAMDFGDSGWWFENGSSLVQSIGGFAITGGGVAKGLQGLSKLAKLKKIGTAMAGANATNKAGQVAQTLGTAVGLNQAEGILEAGDVYSDVYQYQLNKLTIEGLSEEEADAQSKQIAADAAALTIQTNRLNIVLNITSARLFTASPRLTRNILTKQTTAKNIGYGLLEGGQESAEEVINYIAGQRGRKEGKRSKEDRKNKIGGYTMKDLYFDVISDESKEAALLGFMGGLGQTIITKEGVNRINKTVDPETGDKISVRAYNKLAYKRQQAELKVIEEASKTDDVKSFTDIYNSVEKQAVINRELEKAIKEGDENKVKVLQKLSLDTQALNAFKSGTTEPLIKLYEDLANGDQKVGMDENYREVANKAVERIKSLEDIYNSVANEVNFGELYHNRSLVNNYENEIDRKNIIINNKKAELAKQESRLDSFQGDENIRKKHRQLMRKVNPLRAEIRDIQNSIDYDFIIMDFLNQEYEVKNSKKYKKDYKQKLEQQEQEVEEAIDEVSEEVQEAYDTEQEEIEIEEAAKETSKTLKTEKEEDNNIKNAKKQSNTAYQALESVINDADTYDFEPVPNSPGIFFPGGSNKHIELMSQIPGLENIDPSTQIIVTPTSEGIQVQLKDVEGNITSFNIEQYNVVDEDTSNSQQEVNDSVTDVNNNDSQLKSSDNEILSKEINDSQEKKLNKAKDASLVQSNDPNFSSPNYKEYRENPINKVGQEVTFSMGYPEESKFAQRALDLFNEALKGKVLTDVEFKRIVRHLPIKVNFNEDTFTHLSFESELSQTSLTDAEYKIKENIITQAILNKSLDGITSKVAFQYPGVVKQDTVESKPATNSILDLEYINNNLSNIEYYISDSNGNILSLTNEPNPSFGRSSFPGNIFVKVKTANGKDFPLKLNIRRLNDVESDIALVITEALLNPVKKLKYKDVIGNKQEEIVFTEEQLEVVKKEAKILGKSMKNLTVIDLLSSLIYEGTSDKNLFKISGSSLTFGNNIISHEDFESNKGILKNWLLNNKNRNVKKAKLREKAYKEYMTKEVLSTDAKLGEPLFGGNTKMYISTDVNNSNKPASNNNTLKDKKADIEKRRQEELDNIGQKVLQRRLKDLKEATTDKQIAQAIINVEKNAKAGAKITKEEQAFVDSKKQELKDKGVEIVSHDNKVFNVNENIVVQNFTRVEENETLSEEEIKIVEKELESRKRRVKKLMELKGISEAEAMEYLDDSIGIKTTVQPQLNKDGKMIQSAKVDVKNIFIEDVEAVLERSRKNPNNRAEERVSRINTKYDAELNALENNKPKQSNPEYLVSGGKASEFDNLFATIDNDNNKTEFQKFIDTGEVSDSRLQSISQAISEGLKLTSEDIAIYQSKGTEIENILKSKVNINKKPVTPNARKKAKGKIKGGLKANLRARKNNNNSNVNDIPSTDDKNKKC